MMREWIIFALCLGVGGHIALGFVMHAPSFWPWSMTGYYGFMSGLVVYGHIARGVVMNGEASRGCTLGVDLHCRICMDVLYVRLST